MVDVGGHGEAEDSEEVAGALAVFVVPGAVFGEDLGEGFPGVGEVVAAFGDLAELAGGGFGFVGLEAGCELGDEGGAGVVPGGDGGAGAFVGEGVEGVADAAGSEGAEGGSTDEGVLVFGRGVKLTGEEGDFLLEVLLHVGGEGFAFSREAVFGGVSGGGAASGGGDGAAGLGSVGSGGGALGGGADSGREGDGGGHGEGSLRGSGGENGFLFSIWGEGWGLSGFGVGR